MFSALREKFSRSTSGSEVVHTNSNPPGLSNNHALPTGVETINPVLQRRFARGIQYNMRIVLKGDRNVGKTALFHRLQGIPPPVDYKPTEEIQVATIQWSYKTTDDVVKVEVWDVVDKGKSKRKPMPGLKLSNLPAECTFEEMALDASFVDVYKGAHGVILLYDITKPWTWDYVENEIRAIPPDLPILVLGNHRDMGHHRQVTTEKAVGYLEGVERGSNPELEASVRYAESSMQNGFGLKYVYLFFNLPFVNLQRQTLMALLERNSQEREVTLKELTLFEESEDYDYDAYLERLTRRRREEAEKLAPKTASEAAAPAPKPLPGQSKPKVTPEKAPAAPSSAAAQVGPSEAKPKPTGSAPTSTPTPKPDTTSSIGTSAPRPQGSVGKNCAPATAPPKPTAVGGAERESRPVMEQKLSFDNGGDIEAFLDGETPEQTNAPPIAAHHDVSQSSLGNDDSDDEGPNRFISTFEEDVDAADLAANSPPPLPASGSVFGQSSVVVSNGAYSRSTSRESPQSPFKSEGSGGGVLQGQRATAAQSLSSQGSSKRGGNERNSESRISSTTSDNGNNEITGTGGDAGNGGMVELGNLEISSPLGDEEFSNWLDDKMSVHSPTKRTHGEGFPTMQTPGNRLVSSQQLLVNNFEEDLPDSISPNPPSSVCSAPPGDPVPGEKKKKKKKEPLTKGKGKKKKGNKESGEIIPNPGAALEDFLSGGGESPHLPVETEDYECL